MNDNELFTQLKNLQRLEADTRYREQSKAAILATPQRRGFWGTVFTQLEVGASVAFAAALIIAILGGLSSWRVFAPFHAANLDTAGLKAEAQAIDAQIQFTNLTYSETTRPRYTQPSPQQSSSTSSPEMNISGETTAAPSSSSPAIQEATSSDEAVSVDEALELLSR